MPTDALYPPDALYLLSRRDFLKISGLVAASAVLASCRPLYQLAGGLALTDWQGFEGGNFLALNRLTFGPRPAERARVAEIGLTGWVEEQLAPQAIDDLGCSLRLRNLDTLGMSGQQLFDQSDQLFDTFDLETIPAQLRQGTLIRQVYSQRQLYEVLVEFWNDHFNITTDKGECYYLKTVDDREVARAHALGNFRDLLWASTHSPAMLTYLDNQANHKDAPNENYARELMELHTLGVNGGYTQNDVMALARCLTGWGVKEHFWRGEFTFNINRHETGEKIIFGQRIPGSGQDEAERVIERLAADPATANTLAEKLGRRFLGDDPPIEIVQKAAAVFKQTEGDIRATLRVILLDGLPLAKPKYRRPVNFVCAALRLLNAESDCGEAVQDFLLRMGQRPFKWPTPDGYPDRAEAWQGNLLPRWQFAFALVNQEIEKTSVDLPALLAAAGASTLPQALDALSSLLLGAPLTAVNSNVDADELLAAIYSAGASADEEHPSKLRLLDDEVIPILAAGLLACPAFQWR